jgi:hypothetical protein
MRDGSYQPDPVTGELGAEQVDRQDDALAEAGNGRVPMHHLLVGQDFRPTDIELAVDARWRSAAITR